MNMSIGLLDSTELYVAAYTRSVLLSWVATHQEFSTETYNSVTWLTAWKDVVAHSYAAASLTFPDQT